MTDLRKAAEMALDYIRREGWTSTKGKEVWEALHQALAQPEQEPVVYLDEGLGAFYWPNQYKKNVGFTPLYAVPPHRWSNVTDDCLMEEVRRRGFVIRDAQIGRELVGLSDEERHGIREWQEIQKELGPVWAPMMLYLYVAIEAKLKEKNSG